MATSEGNCQRSPCTPGELLQLVMVGGSGMVMMPSRSSDEVYPNVFIGEKTFALNKAALKKVGITHVLNVAQGTGFGHVDTDAEYYQDLGIEFSGIKAQDSFKFKIDSFLNETSDIIENALQSQGKILVHCVEGFSRSATVVIAFLMLKRGMDARQALSTVRAKREVCPNDGFMKQLCELNDKLIEEKQ